MTAGDLLTLEELRRLRRLSGVRGAALVLHAWAVIAGAMVLYVVSPSALTLAIAVLLIGGRQLGLVVLMHEAAHWRLFASGRLNTWVGTWLCAAPLAEDLRRYRRRHHLHHRDTLGPDDPDRASSASIPASWRALSAAALRDLSGVSAGERLIGWRPWQDGLGAAWRRSRAPVLANATLAGALAVAGRFDLYLLLWLLPWATWYQLVTRLRALAEHGMVADPGDPLRNARTIGAGPMARAVLAPYWVNHHLEHHLLVFVPCWKLRQVRALLVAKGFGDRIEMASSYVEVIRRAARAAPIRRSASASAER